MVFGDLIECQVQLGHGENTMHAKSIVSKFLSALLPPMHARRHKALCAAVDSSLRGQPLAVTALGRGLSGNIDEKHQIKRMDRVLSNHHLQAQRVQIYTQSAKRMLGACSRPVIAVDWSDLDGAKRHFLLRASLIIQGRALTLYEEVHTLGTKEKRRTHGLFLRQLQGIVGAQPRPILLTDAGFRTPWFRQVLALGWDYVGRIRNRHLVRVSEQTPWFDAKALYTKATPQPKELGEVELTRAQPLHCRLVVVRRPKQGRCKWTLSGERARSGHSKQHARRAREPWLLVTSLSAHQVRAKRIVRLYAQRMQIEEAFRDLKSERFGLGFEVSRSTDTRRIGVLLLIAMLTLLLAWLIGKSVELLGQHRRYQANTERRRRVLSTTYIGRRAVHDARLHINTEQFIAAAQHLATLVHNAFNHG